MEMPPYYAPLLALAAHLAGADAPAEDLDALPFFRQFSPSPQPAAPVALHLAAMEHSAALLATAPDAPASALVGAVAATVEHGLAALLLLTGCAELAPESARREVGRLVVKSAFTRPLSCYAAGPYGDFSAHRLPLSGYKPGLHIAADDIAAQAGLAQALRQNRKRRAITVRQQVQDNPNTALRNKQTGKVLTQFTTEHWQQLTWRLGYTTVFDLVAAAGEQAALDTSDAPTAPELRQALTLVADYFQQVVLAYAAKPAPQQEPTYTVVAEVIPVALPVAA